MKALTKVFVITTAIAASYSQAAQAQCADDSECKGGRVCRSGQCVDRGCTKDTDCPGELICRDGSCQKTSASVTVENLPEDDGTNTAMFWTGNVFLGLAGPAMIVPGVLGLGQGFGIGGAVLTIGGGVFILSGVPFTLVGGGVGGETDDGRPIPKYGMLACGITMTALSGPAMFIPGLARVASGDEGEGLPFAIAGGAFIAGGIPLIVFGALGNDDQDEQAAKNERAWIPAVRVGPSYSDLTWRF